MENNMVLSENYQKYIYLCVHKLFIIFGAMLIAWSQMVKGKPDLNKQQPRWMEVGNNNKPRCRKSKQLSEGRPNANTKSLWRHHRSSTKAEFTDNLLPEHSLLGEMYHWPPRKSHHLRWHQSTTEAAEGWPLQQMPDLDLKGDVTMRSRGENTGHSFPEIPTLTHWEAHQAEKSRNAVIDCNALYKRCHCQPSSKIETCDN
jgi:hypothetical protein